MSERTMIVDDAAELRAEIARRQVQIYRLAPLIGMHPSHLGQVLRGRRTLSPDLAERIRGVLRGIGSDGAVAFSGHCDGRAA